MNREDEYEEEVKEIFQCAKAIENQWNERSDENKKNVREVPSNTVVSTSYRAMGWRPRSEYFQGGRCNRCQSTSIRNESVCAGCRHNGDGYGSYFHYCSNCGLIDWDSYDEA